MKLMMGENNNDYLLCQVPLERSKPFLLARSLGASVRSHVTRDTTHLVAARMGTAKVRIVIIVIIVIIFTIIVTTIADSDHLGDAGERCEEVRGQGPHSHARLALELQ